MNPPHRAPESSMFAASLEADLFQAGVVAVLIIEDANDAVPLARALLEGGVRAIELTLRTPAAIDALHRIRRDVPAMIAGMGTVLTPTQVAQAVDAGAHFGVAPGMNPRVVQEARRLGLSFAPGICTPTDIELALEQGCRTLKFFPAEPSGGLDYLRVVAAPFNHLGVRYLPLGGIGPHNAQVYLGEANILAIGGSWLAPREAIQKRDWSLISTQARAAADLVHRLRGAHA